MTTKVGPIDPIYNKLLNDAFSAHMKGRTFGEEETADAFEHFKAGFDKNYSPVAPTQASVQASAAKDEAIRQLKAELEAERVKH